MPEQLTIGEYLTERLYDLGIRHVFAVPGPFVDELVTRCVAADLTVVTPVDGQSAGFMADAYARMRGLGVAIGGYGVGALQLVNSVAQAYAERSPLLVIGGAPGLAEPELHPLLDGRRDASPQRQVFAPLTAAWAALDDPDVAFREIERVLAIMQRETHPGYLEIPRDILDAAGHPGPAPRAAVTRSDPRALEAALNDATAMLDAAERPVMVLGVEVQRFGLQDPVLRLLANAGIPAAVTLLGKSVIGEEVPGFLGVYAGAGSRPAVRDAVESSDAVLLIGARPTDLNPGGMVPRLDPVHSIDARGDRLAIGYHTYEKVRLADFITGLAARDLRRREPITPRDGEPRADALADGPLTRDRLFARLASFLTDEMVVIADPGESLFAAADLPIRLCSEFMSPASYGARGFAIPASIGVQLAEPELRPVVLIEASAFPMTGAELATASALGLDPIVVVLHQPSEMHESLPADTIVRTSAELDVSLNEALDRSGSPYLLSVLLDMPVS
jgi:TPP-dependent 2-oxoacid decarboxylase